MKPIDFIKKHQQMFVLGVGYLAAAGLGFGLGQMTAISVKAPEIKMEQAFAPLNNTANTPDNQTGQIDQNPKITPTPTPKGIDECPGQIKGNISAKGDKIYHIPGSSAYNRTDPEKCFNTEAEAQAAGFRKAGS